MLQNLRKLKIFSRQATTDRQPSWIAALLDRTDFFQDLGQQIEDDVKQIAEAYRNHATPRSCASYDPEGMPSNDYLAERLRVRLAVSALKRTYNSKACKTLDRMATQLGKTQQKQTFIWSVFIKETDWAYSLDNKPLTAERGGADIVLINLAPEGEDMHFFDVMVFVCPADEPCIPHRGTFDSYYSRAPQPLEFQRPVFTCWMEATAPPDQAGAKVQRRPRAVYIGVSDNSMGVSVPAGHLFWQKHVPITFRSRLTGRSDVLLTVIHLPEREVDWLLDWPEAISFWSGFCEATELLMMQAATP